MKHNPFSRAIAMTLAIRSALATPDAFARQIALGAIGPYVSRGHGGKRAHSFTGIARAKRAASKARNVQRSKKGGAS